MIYITYYNGLSLPDVSCYFQVDYLNGLSDRPVSAGDKVLFLMLKNKKDEGEVAADDIYPIATRGTVESIDGEWALIHTSSRVSLDSIRVNGKIFELPPVFCRIPWRRNMRFWLRIPWPSGQK